MFVGRDQKAGSAAGRIKYGLILLRVNDADDKVDDVARRTKLSGIPLTAEDREKILKGISQLLAVIIRESVDLLEKKIERFRIAVWQVSREALLQKRSFNPYWN